MDEDKAFPHALTLCSQPFAEPMATSNRCTRFCSSRYERNAPALAGQGVTLAAPAPVDESTTLKAPAKFARYASSLAESLPERVGSLVFILAPRRGGGPCAVSQIHRVPRGEHPFRLAEGARARPSDGPDARRAGARARENRRADAVSRARKKSNGEFVRICRHRPRCRPPSGGNTKGCSPALRSRTGVTTKPHSSSAHGRAKPSRTARPEMQRAPTTTSATRCSHRAHGRTPSPRSAKACELCSRSKLIGLAPFAYANLGIGLHRNGEFAQAFASLKVARDMFKAQNHRAGEAYRRGRARADVCARRPQG